VKTIKLLENEELAVARPQAWATEPIHNCMAADASHAAVALQAYLIYVKQGRPQGRDFQHWLEAEVRCRPPESRA